MSLTSGTAIPNIDSALTGVPTGARKPTLQGLFFIKLRSNYSISLKGVMSSRWCYRLRGLIVLYITSSVIKHDGDDAIIIFSIAGV